MPDPKPRGPRRAATRVSTAIRLATEAGPEACKSLLELVRDPDAEANVAKSLAELEEDYKANRAALLRERDFVSECIGADEGTLGTIELYVKGLADRAGGS